MKSVLPRNAWAAIGLTAMLLCSAGHASITVTDYYRLGDADPGATNTATVNATSQDSAGTKPLTRIGSPTYTSDVFSGATLRAGSHLAVSFSGSGQGLSNGGVSTVTDNFGIEAWVRTKTSAGNHSIAYNGNTSSSGWGLYQFGGTYGGLFGGVSIFGSIPATVNDWAHLALVRASGVTILYLNGAPQATNASAPNLPAGGFGVALPGQGGGTESFNGDIDEVRVFTFAAGQFSTNDLLLNTPFATGPVRKAAALLTDTDANGKTNAGDRLRYTISFTNTFGTNLLNVQLNDLIAANQAIVGGSIKSAPIARPDSYTAIGNTLLTVLPIAGVLTNDSDPDANPITVTAFQNPSAQGGTVSVAANGNFTYISAPGFNGSDTFTYTISDGQGGTASSTATINVANRVWYVNNAGTNGNGTQTAPFNSLANVNAPSSPGDFIYVFQGSGNYSPGVTLKDNQELVGSGNALIVGGTTVINVGTPPTIRATSGTGVTLASGNIVHGLNAGSDNGRAFSGASVGNLVITNANATATGGAVASLTNGTVNIALNVVNGTNSVDNAINLNAINGNFSANVGFIQNAAGAAFRVSGGTVNVTNGTGMLQTNNAPLVNISGGHTNGTLTFQSGNLTASGGPGLVFDNADGTCNFNSQVTLAGGAASIQITNGSDGNFTFSSGTFVNNPTGTPAFRVIGGTANVTYNGGLTANSGVSLISISGGHSGTITFQTGIFTVLAGDGLQFDNADGTYNVFSTVNLNGGDAGIDIVNGSSGNFTFSNAPITNPTGPAFRVNGGNGTISHAGTITKSSVGQVVDIQNRIGGTVTLSGNITDNGGTGIRLTGNTNATIHFSGTSKVINVGTNTAIALTNNPGCLIDFINNGLDVDTTSGNGFVVVGGGSVTVSGTGNSITTGTGTTFLNSGIGAFSAAIDINATLTGTGRLIDIQNRTGATVTLSGNLTNSGGAGLLIQNNGGGTINLVGPSKTFNTGANTAVNLVNNSGTTLLFTPGALSITTTTGTGFNATGGGTISVIGLGNIISSGTGTALNVLNTTIGANGLTFQSISSSGGSATGIILDGTGTSGGLTVTGTGAAASGGTIANKTGADGSTTTGVGIYLNNTANISFSRMQMNGLQNFGIRGVNVTNFIFNDSVINGLNGSSGGAFDEAAISFNTLLGSASISRCNIAHGFEYVVKILNNSGTLNRLTVDATTFGANDNALGGDALQIVASQTSTINVTVTNCTFTNAREDLFNAAVTQTANMDLVFRNNNLGNNHANKVSAASNFLLFSTSTGTVNYDVTHNTMTTGATGSALAVAKGVPDSGSGGTMTGTVKANTIGLNGVVGSGSQFTGIFASALGSGTHTTLIDNNIIYHYNEEGIFLKANDPLTGGNSVLNATLTANQTLQPDSFAFAGLWIVAGSGSGTESQVVNVLLGNSSNASLQNDFTAGDPANATDVFFQESGSSSAINLSRAGSVSGTVALIVADDNVGTPAVASSGTVNLVNTSPPLPPPVAP